MSCSDLGEAGKTELQKRWETRVEKEVNSIKDESKTKVTDAIARAWAENRKKIKLSKQGRQSPPHGPLLPIPKVALSSEPSSSNSSGDDRDKNQQKKKRVFAKVTSEKSK